MSFWIFGFSIKWRHILASTNMLYFTQSTEWIPRIENFHLLQTFQHHYRKLIKVLSFSSNGCDHNTLKAHLIFYVVRINVTCVLKWWSFRSKSNIAENKKIQQIDTHAKSWFSSDSERETTTQSSILFALNNTPNIFICTCCAVLTMMYSSKGVCVCICVCVHTGFTLRKHYFIVSRAVAVAVPVPHHKHNKCVL